MNAVMMGGLGGDPELSSSEEGKWQTHGHSESEGYTRSPAFQQI